MSSLNNISETPLEIVALLDIFNPARQEIGLLTANIYGMKGSVPEVVTKIHKKFPFQAENMLRKFTKKALAAQGIDDLEAFFKNPKTMRSLDDTPETPPESDGFNLAKQEIDLDNLPKTPTELIALSEIFHPRRKEIGLLIANICGMEGSVPEIVIKIHKKFPFQTEEMLRKFKKKALADQGIDDLEAFFKTPASPPQ
jgi:hypothetical protein